nr:SpoIIE family protein phosphatase [Tenuifilaceae bacterium]
TRNITLSAHVIVFTFFIICLLLFAFLGINNSGVLWYYVFSGLAILLTGTKKGSIYIFLITLLTIVLLVNPLGLDVNEYPFDFVVRFFASFAIVNLFIFIFEYTRYQANKSSMLSLRKVERKNEELEIVTRKLNRLNKLLIDEKKIVEQKNLQILSSIEYAQYIQNAVLPNNETIKKLFPDSFILNMPKDIVSGDFYFLKQIKNYKLFAVADCTGHGVPGALMSMLSIALLNEIVRNSDIKSSSQVLNELRRQIIESLHQIGRKGEQKEGLDIAFCSLNTEDNMLSYAGARIPLFLFRNNELNIINADKFSVDIYFKNELFIENQIEIKRGDELFLFSDGYYSQIGEKTDKTYKISHFKDFLAKIHPKSVEEQKQLLESELDEWRGSKQQLDDVLVLGIKF